MANKTGVGGFRRVSDEQLMETVEAIKRFGSVKRTAKEMGLNRSSMQHRMGLIRSRLGIDLESLQLRGRVEAMETRILKLPKKGEVRRYVLTSAQNNTHLWQGFNNLLAIAEHYGAEVFVGTFSYSKGQFGAKAVKRGTLDRQRFEGLWYDDALEEYLCDERLQLAPGLVWCGEWNSLPTAMDPLSGLDRYADRQSCIFPHAKMDMRSVASGKLEGTKLLYTTGTVTQRNYIAKAAGLKADFDHKYGGLLVEVCHDGTWFVRQLEAGPDDSIHDLDLRAQAGVVTAGHRVEAITPGDVHVERLEEEQRELVWGEGGIVDTLRPRHQILHDVLDFRSRNHHETRNPHRMFQRHMEGREDVREETRRAAQFLKDTTAIVDDCLTVVVRSNHDEAMDRWLREADYRYDPVNAVFFLETQLAKYRAIQDGDKGFIAFEHTARSLVDLGDRVRFLRDDESFILCKDDGRGGIEAGYHGDKGANGAKGTPDGLRKYGRRLTIGDKHSAGIYGGLHVVGVTASLDMEYNKGPSSWTHSHGITYPNGTRAIVTTYGGRWRA